MTRTARLTRSRAGFTFVEVMVVLLLIAMMAGLSVVALGALDGSKVRAETIRMSGAIRFVYGRAAINGIRYQLVINLDEDTYRVECSEDNTFVAPTDEGVESSGLYDEDDDEADPFGLGAPAPTMNDCSEELLESRTLRDGVHFARAVTTHHDEPVEDGEVTIAFFPNGFVERSMVWLTDKNQSQYMTLSIDPMTGRVRTHGGDLEVPEDFFAVEEDR